jgi:cytochrome c biogenesis protein CcmG, thiol:disulfide interchange protein DsbE
VTGRLKLAAQGLAVVMVAALLGLLIWKVAHDDSGAAGKLAKGEHPVAPAFTLERLDGAGSLSLAALRGKALVVNFWASWCVPCKGEAPALQRTYAQYRRDGLVVVGVDAEDFKADAKHFAKRYGLTYPIVRDVRKDAVAKWGVTGYPETFFVDRQGRLVGERLEGGIDTARNKDAFAEGVALALGTTP